MQGYFYYIFGFLFLVGVLTVIITIEVSIVCTYVQLCAEDYLWWCAPATAVSCMSGGKPPTVTARWSRSLQACRSSEVSSRPALVALAACVGLCWGTHGTLQTMQVLMLTSMRSWPAASF